MTNQVKKMMDALHITEAEALELIEADKEIDHGAKLFELPDELKAGAKKARRGERKKPEHINRERKVNETKKNLLALCREPIEGAGAKVLAEKTETEITFELNGNTYTLKLIRHRPPK